MALRGCFPLFSTSSSLVERHCGHHEGIPPAPKHRQQHSAYGTTYHTQVLDWNIFSVLLRTDCVVTCLPSNRDIFRGICRSRTSRARASDHGGRVEDHTHVDFHPSSETEVERSSLVEITSRRVIFKGILPHQHHFVALAALEVACKQAEHDLDEI
jgi:hypothetical protein